MQVARQDDRAAMYCSKGRNWWFSVLTEDIIDKQLSDKVAAVEGAREWNFSFRWDGQHLFNAEPCYGEERASAQGLNSAIVITLNPVLGGT